jgi:hypothetical protein
LQSPGHANEKYEFKGLFGFTKFPSPHIVGGQKLDSLLFSWARSGAPKVR